MSKTMQERLSCSVCQQLHISRAGNPRKKVNPGALPGMPSTDVRPKKN